MSRLFSGKAYFSPAVPIRTKMMWRDGGGQFALKFSLIDYFFYNGQQDPGLMRFCRRLIQHHDCRWIEECFESMDALEMSTYQLDILEARRRRASLETQQSDTTLVAGSSDNESVSSIGHTTSESTISHLPTNENLWHEVSTRLEADDLSPHSILGGISWAACADPDSCEVDNLLIDREDHKKSASVSSKSRKKNKVRSQRLPSGFREVRQPYWGKSADVPRQSPFWLEKMNPMGIQSLPFSAQVLLRSVCAAPVIPLVSPRLVLDASTVLSLRDGVSFSTRPFIPLAGCGEYGGQQVTVTTNIPESS